MCKVQMLRALVNERIAAAVAEIFAVLERTIAEYEEELCRTKDENERQRQLLAAVFEPRMESRGADVSEEDLPPEQPGWISRVEQQEPRPPNIKEEEQPWTRQDADVSRFPVTCVIVKSEEDDAEAQWSQRDHGQSEAKRRSEAGSLFAPVSDGDNAASHPPDVDDEDCQADVTHTHFGCSQCDKIFDSKSHLQKHEKRHTDNKHLKCSRCDKTFGSKTDLQRHVRIHTGEKPFSCAFCDRKFSVKGNLIAHARTHTGEKTFPCSSCGQSFGVRSALRRHERTHTGEKPFSCSVCGERFSQKGHMMRHARTHTGEKPFSCSLCEKKFSEKYNIKKHKCAC
ncbi:zinc finger and SCAN domain-containing protein 2-like isoform X2 [Dunckerocampus dactyliophorus]|uniref:zinc finger and SCAN domain-containing protein 2-like isoform X2 n=1 Tax=Dunckerocampus dactyliophorus TaxID=161453 RepID=UPI0024071BF6|nr:zinc finger and SCAN domain-containing protein 2-like isoform X2 [Dunckerocampus dactyliophorus]